MNPKIIGIAAGAGFILSLFIGLISRNHLFALFIHALLCAVVCAGMTAGITVIFTKFLAEDVELESSQSVPRTGGIVDITLSDEKLTEVKNAPKFNVSNNLKSMNEDKTSVIKTQLSESTASASETSEQKAEKKIENTSGEANTAQTVSTMGEKPTEESSGGFKAMDVASVAASSEKKSKEIDEDVVALPDIGEFNSSDDDSAIESATSIADVPSSEPVVLSAPKAQKGATFADGSGPSVQDAATIAQAIRTVLAKES